MTVSRAFDELSAVLTALERGEAGVRDVTVDEEVTPDTDELTAQLRVATPLFDGADVSEDVRIRAGDSDLEAGRLEFDVTVEIPIEGASDPGSGDGTLSVRTDSDGVPAYKDPDALAAAYEECDSFPEMTDALDADVTPETVRRHTVKHGIHDPEDGPPHVGSRGESGDATGDRTDDGSDPPASAGTGDDAPGGGHASSDDGDREDPSERAVADVLAAADRERGSESHAADGLGIRRDLTVGEFVDVLGSSRTVREVARRLDVEYETARQFLDEYDLRTFVTGRLTAEPTDVTAEEFHRQVGASE